MSTSPLNSAFYADPQGLSALRQDVRSKDPEAIKAVARQFEALFTSMMLKSMRDATPKDGLFSSDQQDFYQEMFDQQIATQMSKGKGLGLAEMLVHQLKRTGLQPPQAAAAPADPAVESTATPTASVVAWPPASREGFVQALKPAAEAAGRRLGVDPETLIAHAALESGWGQRLPRNADGSPSFNLFGIKAGSRWNGAVATARTTEFVNGQPIQVQAAFRSYGSPEASMEDYATMLASRQRYAGALGTGSDARAFATGLQQGGYATDPNYVTKLTTVAGALKSARDLPLT
ncbi:MAG: hypothetical protein RLZZ200_1291 [Pseudomonadota bacterium]|jgi:flagellar protein FlgJ